MQILSGHAPAAKQKALVAWAWTGPKGPDYDRAAFTVVGIETYQDGTKLKREPMILVEGRITSLSDAVAEWGPSVVWSLEDWDWPTGVRELEEKLEEHGKAAIAMEERRVQ